MLVPETTPIAEEAITAVLKSLTLEEVVRRKLRMELDREFDGCHSRVFGRIMGRVESQLMRLTHERFGGNQVTCARMLGINRNTLRKKFIIHSLIQVHSRGRRRSIYS